MIFDWHGQPADARIRRQALPHGRAQDLTVLETHATMRGSGGLHEENP